MRADAGFDVASVKVGLELPTFTRAGSFEAWNRFAAVTYQFSAHHMDDEIGRHEGFKGAFVMAPLSHAYLHGLLRQWMGHGGRIIVIDMRLKNPLIRGRVLTAGGTVTAVRDEGSERIVDLDLWQVDDEGTPLGTATAQIALPLE